MAIIILAIQAFFNVEISLFVIIPYQAGLIFEFAVMINLLHRSNNIFEILAEVMMDRKFIFNPLSKDSNFVSKLIFFPKELIPLVYIRFI
jgi:hypothetical protein